MRQAKFCLLVCEEVFLRVFPFLPHLLIGLSHMSCIVRKPNFCLTENKGATNCAVQNCEADQCLCFRYTDSTFVQSETLFFKSEISSFLPASVTV